MKKKVVGYMTIGLLAVAMMVQAQPASRQERNLPVRDSIERLGPMNRMGAMGGPRMGTVRPGQFGQRDSVREQASLRRMQRGGALSEPGNRMQRSGALSAPGNRGFQRGGVAPGFGLRNRQGGMQVRPQGGLQGRPQGGIQRGLQPGRGVDPEKRIENEVEQLKQSLDLSSDQVKKITDIKKKQAKKEIKAYKKSQKKAEARRKKAEAPNDKIKSVLTEEQVKKFESLRPQGGSGVRSGVRPSAGPRPGASPGPGVGPRSGSDSNRFGGAGFGGRRL